jgi:glycosyltransferase involved in cell wall biosynthesis
MKIGLFTDTYHPAVNGICFVIDITRKQLEALGHEVFIFAPKPSIRYKEIDDHIRRYPSIRGVDWEEDMTSIFFPPREVRYIRNLNLDIIHFFTPDQVGLLGAYASIRKDIPLVAQHSTDIINYADYYSGYMKALLALPLVVPVALREIAKDWRKLLPRLEEKRFSKQRKRITQQYLAALYGRCDGVIALSPRMDKQLKSWHGNLSMTMIPTGVDPLPFEKGDVESMRKEFQLSQKNKVVLYVGRIVQEKNLEMLIEAFAFLVQKIPDAKLMFVGNGDYLEATKDFASQFLDEDQFIFTGNLDHNKLGAIYELGDVFAFPSLTDTQGLVLNEAANAGLPLVTAVDDMNEVISNNENGMVVGDSAREFSKALFEILSSKTLYKKMSDKSRDLASNYSALEQTKILVDYYHEVIERHQKK